jgi:hypothetical protein
VGPYRAAREPSRQRPQPEAAAAPRPEEAPPALNPPSSSQERTVTKESQRQVPNNSQPSAIDLVSTDEETPVRQNPAPVLRKSARPRKLRRESPEPTDPWDKTADRLHNKSKQRQVNNKQRDGKKVKSSKKRPAQSRSPPPPSGNLRAQDRAPGKT